MDDKEMGGMADMMKQMMGNMGPGNMGPENMGPGNMGPGNMGPGNMGPGNMGPGTGMPMMDMMAKMMPQGLGMMMERLPKDQRLELAKEMVAVMAEKACEGLTEDERNQFFDDLVVTLRPEDEKK